MSHWDRATLLSVCEVVYYAQGIQVIREGKTGTIFSPTQH